MKTYHDYIIIKIAAVFRQCFYDHAIKTCGIIHKKQQIHTKGQIISECPYEIIVYPKIATKKFSRFLSWKFTTSRLTQKKSLCSVCKKIDSVL